MPLEFIVLLFGGIGYIIDFIGKRNQKQQRKSQLLLKQSHLEKKVELVNPITKKPIDTRFFGVLNSVHDETPQKQPKDVLKSHLSTPKNVVDLIAFEEDVFEDEESFETELTTPMSMVVDEEPLFSETEWETIAQEKSDVKVVSLKQSKPVKKRNVLQKAYIYSEVFGKPKGLE